MKKFQVLALSFALLTFSDLLYAETVLDATLDSFKGQKFADVQQKSQKYIDECVSLVTRNRLPKFENSYQDKEYQVLLHQAKTGTCDNNDWTNDLKSMCMRTLIFHIKTEDEFAKYLEEAKRLNMPVKSQLMAETIFYKDPTLCDHFMENYIFMENFIFEEEPYNLKKVSYSICKAITTPAGINACHENFEKGTEDYTYCAEGYTLYQAVQTKNINECQKISIRDDMLRLQCELLVDPSDVEKKIIKHYTENQCYKPYAIPLAVTGVLDPEGPGPKQSEAYCDKIKEFHKTDFDHCQKLLHEAREYVKKSAQKNKTNTESPSP